MICFGFILFNTIFIGAKSVAIYMLFESFFEEGQQFRYLIIFNNKLSMEIKKSGANCLCKMIYFYNFEISNIKSRRHDNQEKHQIFAEEAEKCFLSGHYAGLIQWLTIGLSDRNCH